MADKKPQGLARGLTNYGDAGFSLYLRRSFAKSMGYSGEMLAKPVVGIADSRSGFNNCHRHFPELIEAVKRGVLAAGGLPVEFPTVSLGEVFLSPTSMMFSRFATPISSQNRRIDSGVTPRRRSPAIVGMRGSSHPVTCFSFTSCRSFLLLMTV